MARDRQRAKQRKARRAQNPGPAPSRPSKPSNPLDHNVPSELEHASGEVDEFEAALVAGADGEPDDASERRRGRVRGGRARPSARATRSRTSTRTSSSDELDDASSRRQAVAAAPAERREVAAAPTPGAPTRRGPARFIGFLRASWAELQRVQWPDRRQVAQATAVVIGFVVVAGLYLGVADWVAKKIVDFII